MKYTEEKAHGLLWHCLDNDEKLIYDSAPQGSKRYKIIAKPGSVKLFVIDKIILSDYECSSVEEAQKLAFSLVNEALPEGKVCSKCKEAKASNEFYISKGKLMAYCKACNSLECFKAQMRRLIRTQGSEGARQIRERMNNNLRLNEVMAQILLESA